ncbi:hypothetical protein A2U01_0111352 [Trifolium medium]|uniref:Uncharacterized protein n=1 Tax=Trifolium medium TaxID=97028 RepID=A0A392VRH9_9FABA|nr:hypothetical protein [Trifolium medium]
MKLYTAPGAEDPCAWRNLGEFLRIVDPLVLIAAPGAVYFGTRRSLLMFLLRAA